MYYNLFMIKNCITFKERLIGFIGTKKCDYGLCFPNCNSVHTFFMSMNIDIIMTDKDKKILYIFNNVKPYRIILPKKNVYYVFEFPYKTNYKIGEYIKESNFH